MRGRLQGQHNRDLALAYHIEVFARQKSLRALSHYLQAEKKAPENGASKVLSMFKRLAAKEK